MPPASGYSLVQDAEVADVDGIGILMALKKRVVYRNAAPAGTCRLGPSSRRRQGDR